MKALSVRLKGFRNFEDEQISFSDGVNAIWGKNAQGKTNILEALWFFSVGKSFRASRDREMIKFGNQKAISELSFEAQARQQLFQAEIPETGRKTVSLNGVKAKRTSEIIGCFNSVLFSPEHLTLIKDGSAERRKFMDMAISQISPGYVDLLLSYQKTLEQKNAALKQATDNRAVMDTLDVWDEKLSVTGAKIIVFREKYIARLFEKAREIHSSISDGTEEMTLIYRAAAEERKNTSETAKELFILQKNNRQQDLLRGCTCSGAHRDDLEISLNGIGARHFASQGQQRSSVLSLKIAESMLLEEEYGEIPVLLLDDVLSELDGMRQKFILERIGSGQVIITCCENEKFMKTLTTAKAIEVRNGKLF